MLSQDNVKELAYEYVLALSNKFNPQISANLNYLGNLGRKKVLKILDDTIDKFCDQHQSFKARDFVYKNDYFTPRNMFLIHPLYYLYYTYLVFGIAYEFFNTEIIDFSNKNMKVFYSGYLNFDITKEELQENAQYYKSYRLYQEESYKYFSKPAIKIDVKDFFNSIKVEDLIKKLRNILGDFSYVNDLEYFFKSTGFYYLPQFHFSIASSILSQFYLMDFDNKIRDLLVREDLHLIRYVDDMYIIHLDGREDMKKNNNILNEVSYYLWEDSLVLNTSKTKILSASQFSEIIELLDDDYISENFDRFNSGRLIEEKAKEIVENRYLNKIIESLCQIEKEYGVDLVKYNDLMNKYIAINGGEVNKILNNIIYSEKWKLLNIKDLKKIIEKWNYILFNPTQFTVLYLGVYKYLEINGFLKERGSKIKGLLNFLFNNKIFTLRESLIAISYLFQRKLKHRDLFDKINNVNPDYVKFIKKFVLENDQIGWK